MRRLYLKKYVETLFLFSFICLLNHIRHNVIPISHNVIMPLSVLLNEQPVFRVNTSSYRTIGVYKSAISQTHDPIGQASLGELPIVSRFMKGVFRLNPPKPKLGSTWQLKTVLSHMEKQKPVEELSLKELSHKLILLLALTSTCTRKKR